MGKQRGFTLIELMVVLVILTVIAAIGYPSYTEYVNRGKRAEGKSALMRAAQQMERFYSLNNCYPSNTANCGSAGGSAAALTAVNMKSYSGESAASSAYNLSVTTNAQDFTLTATPTFSDAKCGNLTLMHTGAKNKTGTDSVQNCWSK
ncbi:MAG TPA: type IV pilin protein [Burkholderiales bacterium]|nr:type IV pilin protein [Burkholderiales bacterium]